MKSKEKAKNLSWNTSWSINDVLVTGLFVRCYINKIQDFLPFQMCLEVIFWALAQKHKGSDEATIVL